MATVTKEILVTEIELASMVEKICEEGGWSGRSLVVSDILGRLGKEKVSTTSKEVCEALNFLVRRGRICIGGTIAIDKTIEPRGGGQYSEAGFYKPEERPSTPAMPDPFSHPFFRVMWGNG